MANVKISELTAATSVAATDELEINAGGTSKKATAQKVLDLAASATLTLTNKTLTAPIVTGVSWSSIPAAGTAGRVVFVTDAGSKGSFWYDDGTRWKPLNNSAYLATADSASSNLGTSETIVLQALLPAGMWQTGDVVRLVGNLEKSGATDTGYLVLRIGTAGTTSDTQLKSVANWMLAADRSSRFFIDVRLDSATSAATLVNYSYASTVTGTSLIPASATISSASSNAIYISVSTRSSGSTDTVKLTYGQALLISKAN